MKREPTLKFYLDRKCTKECKDGVIPDFGILDTGESKTISIYLKNSAQVPTVDIHLQVDNPELEIMEFPTALKINEVGVITLKWDADPLTLSGLEGHNNNTGSKLSGTYNELWK